METSQSSHLQQTARSKWKVPRTPGVGLWALSRERLVFTGMAYCVKKKKNGSWQSHNSLQCQKVWKLLWSFSCNSLWAPNLTQPPLTRRGMKFIILSILFCFVSTGYKPLFSFNSHSIFLLPLLTKKSKEKKTFMSLKKMVQWVMSHILKKKWTNRQSSKLSESFRQLRLVILILFLKQFQKAGRMVIF